MYVCNAMKCHVMIMVMAMEMVMYVCAYTVCVYIYINNKITIIILITIIIFIIIISYIYMFYKTESAPFRRSMTVALVPGPVQASLAQLAGAQLGSRVTLPRRRDGYFYDYDDDCYYDYNVYMDIWIYIHIHIHIYMYVCMYSILSSVFVRGILSSRGPRSTN